MVRLCSHSFMYLYCLSSLLTTARFCPREFNTSPGRWLKTMEAADVKAFYDWLHRTHQGRVKALSVLHSYWRRLKMFYRHFNKRGIDSFMAEDVLNVSIRSPTDTDDFCWFEVDSGNSISIGWARKNGSYEFYRNKNQRETWAMCTASSTLTGCDVHGYTPMRGSDFRYQ